MSSSTRNAPVKNETNAPVTESSQQTCVASAGDQCSICCDPFQIVAIGRCNHSLTCAVCALRLRLCYRDNSCPFCKTALRTVYIISKPTPDAPQPDYQKLSRDKKNFTKHKRWPAGFLVDTRATHNGQKLTDYLISCVKLTCVRCDPTGTGEEFGSFKQLRDHVKRRHNGSAICNVCYQAHRYFPRELEIFEDKAVFQSHIETHPMCNYCEQRYFGKDELYDHMKKKHCLCQLCHARGERHVYFENMTCYAQHLKEAHHPCNESDCANSLIAFNTAQELSRHLAEVHGMRHVGGRRQTTRIITPQVMGTRVTNTRSHQRQFIGSDLQQRGSDGMVMIDDDLPPVYNTAVRDRQESTSRSNRPWRIQDDFPALPITEGPMRPAIHVPKKVLVRVQCTCGRISRNVRVDEDVVPDPLTCDIECERAQHRARLAAAFNIDTESYSGAFNTHFSADLVTWARTNPDRVLQIETQLQERIRLHNMKRFQVEGVTREMKKLVIELVEAYGAVGRSVRTANSVEVVLTDRCCLPAKKLQQYATSLAEDEYQSIVRESLKNTLYLEDIHKSVNPRRYLFHWDGDYEIEYISKTSAKVKFRTSQAYTSACQGLGGGIREAFTVRPALKNDAKEPLQVEDGGDKSKSTISTDAPSHYSRRLVRKEQPDRTEELTLGNSFDVLSRL